MFKARVSLSVITVLALVDACLGIAVAVERQSPEPGSGITPQFLVVAERELIAAANPLATQAGADALHKGGSAIDAVITAQLVLNLVEPQSSGIGGGGFLVYYDSRSKELFTYDGRETAPAAARPDMFLKDGVVPTYLAALVGGNSVGAPGLLRMLSLAHQAHGRLSWQSLFPPAIELAGAGFAISPRLHMLAGKVPTLQRFDATASYFLKPNGQAKPVGSKLLNQSYAETLRGLAVGGADLFYSGSIAKEIANKVQSSSINPGTLDATDIEKYQAQVRPPVCGSYRGYKVCGMGPPSSGGIAVLQILGLLERFDIGSMPPWSLEPVHLFLEASRLAFADRNRYVADPDFIDVPTGGLVDQTYLRTRSLLIDPVRASPSASPGLPNGARAHLLADDVSAELPSTTHISIFDRYGNVASLTSSIEFAFGSALMVRGFLLNNQLTDFSFLPEREGVLVANRVEPNKRPRSSMAPTVVFDKSGVPILAIGSPGGSRIICYVAKSLIGILDWGMSPDRAIAQANLCKRNKAAGIEKETLLYELKEQLSTMGHEVVSREMTSGLHVIFRSGDKLIGAADPRREGTVAGQ